MLFLSHLSADRAIEQQQKHTLRTQKGLGSIPRISAYKVFWWQVLGNSAWKAASIGLAYRAGCGPTLWLSAHYAIISHNTQRG